MKFQMALMNFKKTGIAAFINVAKLIIFAVSMNPASYAATMDDYLQAAVFIFNKNATHLGGVLVWWSRRDCSGYGCHPGKRDRRP